MITPMRICTLRLKVQSTIRGIPSTRARERNQLTSGYQEFKICIINLTERNCEKMLLYRKEMAGFDSIGLPTGVGSRIRLFPRPFRVRLRLAPVP